MSLDEPSEEILDSIRGAVTWYEASKITGMRLEKRDGDKRVVRDADASPIRARFYDIKTNRPIFSGRDGVIKYSIAEIESERRNGYSWYNAAGEKVAKCWDGYKWKGELPASNTE